MKKRRNEAAQYTPASMPDERAWDSEATNTRR